MKIATRSATFALLLAPGALAQPANDLCSGAAPITGYTTFNFNNTLATTDGPANALCNANGTSQIERDIWFCWTAPWGGLVSLTTCGQTPADTRIAVYDGCACPEGSGILACNDDGCGIQTRVNWYAQVNQSYLIRIGVRPGAPGGGGTFTIGSGVLFGPTLFTGTGHVYYLLHPSSWTQARDAALVMGGDLVTVDHATENEWVREALGNLSGEPRQIWIGLNDAASEGTFVWSSGWAPGYSNWAPGQPDNAGAGEDYAVLSPTTGLWSDAANLTLGVDIHGVVEKSASCYPDCNNNGQLTIADFGCFQNRFIAQDPFADCNNSGTFTIADFSCFLNSFVAGCP